MISKELTNKDSRFDTRLSKEQKMFFERAATIGGYRNFTEFVVSTLLEKSKEIIQKNDQIIASQRDSELFFDAIFNPQPPTNDLKNAVQAYKKQLK